jgi:hypothetical protein
MGGNDASVVVGVSDQGERFIRWNLHGRLYIE